MSKIHNPFGVACIALLVLFFPTLGFLASLRDRRLLQAAKRKTQQAFPATSYRPIDHVHEIDFHRSGVTITDAGAVFARCAIAGCEEGVFIGQNMAAAWKMTAPPPQFNPLLIGRSPWL